MFFVLGEILRSAIIEFERLANLVLYDVDIRICINMLKIWLNLVI
jgi:hypothetical protein